MSVGIYFCQRREEFDNLLILFKLTTKFLPNGDRKLPSSASAASRPFDLTTIGPFTEEEMTAMARALLGKIDIPLISSGPAPKRPLINYFGLQKSYKTAVTIEAEKIFRRNKFKTYCPPESAEHEDIRDDSFEDQIIHQAKHLNVVTDQYLNQGANRNHHITQLSRNLPDMPYWYIKGERKGVMSPKHVASAKEWIYQLLERDLIDVSLFLTCSVEAAIRREFGQSPTQKRGSKMNEKDIAEAMDIYEIVLKELRANVPNMPIFRIDTSEMTVRQATEEALRYILPTLCIRYEVPDYTFMPYALSLVQKVANHSDYFEEQLKLSGHPDMEIIKNEGWTLMKESGQIDTYLNIKPNIPLDPQKEIVRIRQEANVYKYMYKGESHDHLLSHRLPLTLTVEQGEAQKIIDSHKIVKVLSKHRLNFKKNGSMGDGHFFTLHIDIINELGNFTEIRARGTQEKDHTGELLSLAEELGFGTGSIVSGNYLSLTLNR